jgi:hypothetical protein
LKSSGSSTAQRHTVANSDRLKLAFASGDFGDGIILSTASAPFCLADVYPLVETTMKTRDLTFTWEPSAIDAFLAVGKREQYVMTGKGTVRLATSSDGRESRIVATCYKTAGNEQRVEVRNFDGHVIYIGTKD